MKLKDHHGAYLERMARKMSQETRKRVTKRMVLEVILDLAIADEELYDPEDPGQPLTSGRRAVVQAERQQRTVRLEPHELVRAVLGDPEQARRRDDE